MTYCDFKPGDEVVCVRGPIPQPGGVYPDNMAQAVVGSVYTIRRVFWDGEEHCVQLVEIAWFTCLGDEGAYRALRFRKVQSRKTDLSIEAFLTIKPGFEEPKRAPAPKKERVS